MDTKLGLNGCKLYLAMHSVRGHRHANYPAVSMQH